jgi:hypothetical protein
LYACQDASGTARCAEMLRMYPGIIKTGLL